MGTSLNTPTFESMGLAQVHSGITLLNDNNNNNTIMRVTVVRMEWQSQSAQLHMVSIPNVGVEL